MGESDLVIKQIERLPLTDQDIDFITDPDTADAVKIFNDSLDKNPLKFEILGEDFSPELCQVVKNMLSYNPRLRPTAAEVLKYKVFDSVRSS